MKNFILILTLLVCSLGLEAQTVINLNCSDGIFLDSGGATGNYSDDEYIRYNICPENAGDKVTLQFTEMSTEYGFDTLHIYNGQVVDYNITRLTPFYGLQDGTASYTSTTTDGCLTAMFGSDGSWTQSGWSATISCASGTSTCTDPSALSVTNITGASADLSWTENGSAISWNIEYGASGYTQGTGTVVNDVSNPYTLTGLTANTSYDYYVQANCGGLQSSWVGPYNFMTSQAAINVVPGGSQLYRGDEAFTLFPTSFPESKVQMPIYDTELSNVGVLPGAEIVGLQWEVGTDNTPATSTWNIGISDAYTGGVIAQEESIPFLDLAFTTVATNAADAGQYTGTHTIMFDTPFTWNGSSHLVLQSCRTSPGQNDSDEILVAYESDACLLTHYFANCSETITIRGSWAGMVLSLLVNNPTPCTDPSSLTATNITTTTADLSWTENGTATAWNVEYGAAGYTQGTGTVVSGVTNPYTPTGLTAGTSYDFYVQADCGNGNMSAWVGPFTFMTGSFGNAAVFEGTWKVASEAGALAVGPAYDDYSWWMNSTGDVTTRACFFDDEFVFNPDGTFMNVQQNSTWLEPWQGVNPSMCGTPIAPHDGSNPATWFYDNTSGQLTLTGTGAHLGIPKVINGGELVQPSDAPASITYDITFSSNNDTMRVDIFVDFGWWRFIMAKEPILPCAAPTNVSAVATSSSNVLFSWDAVPDADLYQVKYRKLGTTTWSQFATVHTQRNQSGLQLNTNYQYKVRARCAAGNWSGFTPATSFPNVYSTFDCDEPTGVSSIYLDNTRFKVRWDAAGEVRGKIRYREVGTTTWLSKNSQIGNNYIYVAGLTPDATYEYRIRLNCSGNEWSTLNTLYYHSLNNQARVSQELAGVRVYPNPTRDILNIAYDNELGSDATIQIFDMLGRTIMNEISNDTQVSLNVDQLVKGSYVVSITVDGKQSIQKFVKH